MTPPCRGMILFLAALLSISVTVLAERKIPKPLPDHPGNIFLEGEDVEIAPPPGKETQWKATDYEGRIVREGQVTSDRVQLGKLTTGYYEVRRGDGERVTVGVLTRLTEPTPDDSPISIDVAMAWFYKTEPTQRAAANLCTLAGINWVRDRASWPEIEPKPGELAPHTIYDDTAQIQTEAGLKILQVNHVPPAWEKDRKHFPQDLRDVYRFNREIAARWKGKVLAIEPWNEADIDMFGGQTGSEIASLQKAAYLGLKAGNPDVIACQNVFAVARKETLADFAVNEAPFDTYNLHHYVWFDKYPSVYAAHRNVSTGKPMWVTECNTPVQWSGDPKLKEPTDDDLRMQAKCVAKIYASSLHEGSRNTFYFMLPDYTEGKTQYGLLHQDQTPRPAFMALATVGRLLAGAKPLGKTSILFDGYLFSTSPETRVLVAWSKDPHELSLAADAEVFDHLGRALGIHRKVELTTAPLFIAGPATCFQNLKFQPPPMTPQPSQPAIPSPLILQALFPPEQINLKHSSYLAADRTATVTVFAYNFASRPINANVTVQVNNETTGPPQSIHIAPGDRARCDVTVTDIGRIDKTVRILADSTEYKATLSLTLEPQIRPTTGPSTPSTAE